jgi:predicted CxxxxCH...CXXCH cytochrome family protein
VLRAITGLGFALCLGSCADERAPAGGGGAHPLGWADVDSPAFHGTWLRENQGELARCQTCHGLDFLGGPVGSSCSGQGCHEGPSGLGACGTCHGDGALDPLPSTGAHAAHSDSTYCEACHVVPASLGSPGHLDGGEPDTGDVRFAQLAIAAGATPTYDPATQRCSGSYCHVSGSPAWNDPGPLECDACHGEPPETHARFQFVAADRTRCDTCHAPVPGDRHVDGTTDLSVPGDCATCHGDGAPGAVFVGLDGESDRSRRGAGAHQRHIDPAAPGRVSAAMSCTTCHAMPADGAPIEDHIDAEAPADVALPQGGRWNPADATCAVWCHGGLDRTSPAWTAGTGALSCDGCHGDPPASHASFAAGITAGQCSACHLTPPAQIAEHLDGAVETTFTNGCLTCHGGIDVAVAWQPIEGPAGAHDAHLESSIGRPVECTACHAVPGQVLEAGHLDGLPARVILRDGGAYDPVTQSCTTSCHGGPERTSPSWTDQIEGCESCHDNPPAPHLDWGFGDLVFTCTNCHTEPPGPTHVDGRVTGIQ